MRRIAITGIGSINALGTGVQAFADGLRTATCGIGELTLFPASGFRCARAAEVRDLRAPSWLPRPIARRATRSGLLALISGAEAWRLAGLSIEDRSSAGVVIGTSTGGMATGEELYRQRLLSGVKRQPLSGWLATPVSALVDDLANVFECAGPRLTVSTACSSGANALGIAADWIRAGRVETMLCGGTDALCQMTFSGFNALQALDREPCRPFDKDRAGLTLGEGAAMFVFEDWARARQRRATIVGEFISYGMSADAHHLTQPRSDGAGAVAAIRCALAEGAVAAEEIDYINAHGTGTPLNDVIETRAIKTVFGRRAYQIPVTSTKSMIGHCLGGAGALEALACLLAMRDGLVPATVTLQRPDPECDLDYVPQTSRPAALRTVLSNSYGFGGNNTSIILRGVG